MAEVVPDDQLEAAAQPWSEDLLHASPMGPRMTKEDQTMAGKSPNFAEGVRTFLEKQKPNCIAD